jgi:hypothetical protein|tara:strand:- start:15516 stop:15740 length:225 start_codon:yes stop_codon:yes gene_type:complete
VENQLDDVGSIRHVPAVEFRVLIFAGTVAQPSDREDIVVFKTNVFWRSAKRVLREEQSLVFKPCERVEKLPETI